MISIESLSYRYPGAEQPALSSVDLAIGESELVLVAGASGGGKSTLLRSMNGLIPHFHGGRISGRVTVDGRSTVESRPRDLAEFVGFVGQDPEDAAVAGRLEDDIAFTLENLGLDPPTMRKRVEEVLDALGISALRSRRLDSLSGGERQRAAIASALVAMPSYLVLDEPTSQLDPQSAEEVIGAVLRLRDELGISIVLAEHRLERVLQYGERLVVLTAGAADVGRPAEVLERHEIGPPVVKLARALGWHPVTLSLREARLRVAESLPQGAGVLPPMRDVPSAGELIAELDEVTVNLNGTRALDEATLRVSEGEVVALMGRNGSGKTTLLKTIAGLVEPRAGKVIAPPSIGLVPQNPEAILFRPTVADEIAATLRSRGHAGETDAEGIRFEAERFGVAHILESNPLDLSGGEKTRAAIAAAAAGGPSLLLMDEPTRGLDEEGKKNLIDLVGEWRREGRAVVVATHDVELAARIASRVVLLAKGGVVLDGLPRDALAASLTFSTQMNKVFRNAGILTVEDALRAVAG